MRIKPAAIVMAILLAILLPYAAVLVFGKRINSVDNKLDGIQIESQTEMVSAEDYVVRLVAAEIPVNYHIEALKAQAVIARTYLYQAIGESESFAESSLPEQGWTETKMQEEWGDRWEENKQKIQQAVKETESLVITFHGSLTQLLYHKVSSGTTRTDESGVCPYLKSKESSYDIQADGYLQMKTFTEQEFVQLLQAAYPDRAIPSNNLFATLQILAKDGSGYIEQMQIGGCEFQGLEIANALQMSSCCMSFEEFEGKLRVISRGIGHGYGMSQWGASRMGEEGKHWEEILKYYYDFETGLQIQTIADVQTM